MDSIILRAERAMRDWLQAEVPGSLAHYTTENLTRLRVQVAQAYPDKTHDLTYMRRAVLYEVMRLAGYAPGLARQHADDAFEVFFEGRNQVQFFPGALQMLASLSQRFPLIALTNGNADISRTGLSDFFHGALNSADVGAKKPDPAMFNQALARQGVSAEEAVHVGDHLVDDIHGARNVGMHTVWANFTGAPRKADDPEPHVEITHLDQVGDAIERLNQPAAP